MTREEIPAFHKKSRIEIDGAKASGKRVRILVVSPMRVINHYYLVPPILWKNPWRIGGTSLRESRGRDVRENIPILEWSHDGEMERQWKKGTVTSISKRHGRRRLRN